ncbi:MAG TPA: amylo-alpha-1,6-glucosidase [Pyrinomonadaceae bacterium]|nr:amylo-alpha-1,6-glucosidase [Pyrinomonadaceae bacterium]
MINFDSRVCTDFESASSREWLETNGIGGFASGTISGANTRRYHGLLTAAARPPLGRVTMLSKFEETLFIDGKSYALSANQYPNHVYPQGFKYLKSFRLDPFPVWIFEIEGIEIEKSVFMVDGSNTTIMEYKSKIQNPKSKIELELRPLLSFVDYHHLQHENSDFNSNYETAKNLITVKPATQMPPLYFTHNAVNIEHTGVWYRNFEYAVEKERGFDWSEDLFQPFALKFDLKEAAIVVASTEKQNFSDAGKFRKKEIERREKLVKQAGAKDDFTEQLALAADLFIVSRGAGKTLIAGYPWFSDWGRDTMIALNGLTLATNRPEIAKSILLEFSLHISEGMLPNRFPDAGETPEYNTVDATLWYFEAVRAYARKTGDYRFVEKNLYEKLVNIVLWHVSGTRFQIKVDSDGLLYAGETGTQLTWMDAKIGDYVVTPRAGKAVEIQALWYNALCVMADFAGRFGDKADREKYLEMAQKAKESFNAQFWNDAEECLFDVINGAEKDASVRPNQIFAASLPHAIIDGEKARKIVEKVEAELLTPYGLRSLSPQDKNYCPIYTGTPFERDSAYHQGTAWAWLIGGFIDAYRKVHANETETEKRVAEILNGFKNHLTEAGIGQISEIFDADAPHNPRGCVAQAWSVAEVLRVVSTK